MIELLVLFTLLSLAASLSPLLTALRLWQLKEWRYDRLLDHFRREGVFRQLYGRLRLSILALLFLAYGLLLAGYVPVDLVISLGLLIPISTLSLLACLTAMQLLLRKQASPVWTQKAGAMLVLSLTLDLGVVLLVSIGGWDILATCAFVPFIQPAVVGVAHALLSPIDGSLKRRILSQARALRRKHPELVVIGITGSVGKTTTKELLAHILADLATATPAHVNTEMGVARWLIDQLKTTNEKRKTILIVEMGAYRIGEIALLCEITSPTIGVTTAIGDQHLGLFGSHEAIFQAKSELTRSLPRTGHAFLNGDSEDCLKLTSLARCPCTIVSTGDSGDLRALDIEETAHGIQCTVEGTIVQVSLHGTHNVTNVLLGIGAARLLGLGMNEIASRLKTFRSIARTFQLKEQSGVTILDDTYNASPQSFEAALAWAKNQPQAEKILLTSGIIELGESEERIHTALAGEASKVFARAYVTNPHILPYFQRGGFADRAKSVDDARSVPAGSLLVCLGRMPASTIQTFLP